MFLLREAQIIHKMNGRYEKGLEMMDKLDPTATERLKEIMDGIAPDMVKYVIEFAYGDVIARPGLDLKSREIATMSALTAMGNAKLELQIHIKKALHIGITKEEIVELMLHMIVYAGFPAAINGLLAADEVFKELNL